MQLSCTYVSCGLLLLILASQVIGRTNIRNVTKNVDDEMSDSDDEEDDTYHEHILPHNENGKFELPPVTIQQLCPRGLRMWIPGKIILLFVLQNIHLLSCYVYCLFCMIYNF
jgi:hypothetical protein